MRFVLAILAFAAAAVMIGFGIAQRTVFLEPDEVSLETVVEDQADYIVLQPDALAANPGKQTITVSGAESVFLSYGRTGDVEAWIGDSPYVAVGYDAEADEFTSEVIVSSPVDDDTPATPAPAPEAGATPEADAPAVSPAGSDLWLDELTGERTLTTTVDVPEGISVLLASDGTEPPPGSIEVAWPLDNSTPWAGPLIAGGALVFLVGIGLVISGLVAHRRSRGPRRNLPKGPKGKLTRAPRPSRSQQRAASGAGPRRSLGRQRRALVAPLLLVPALALSACSADYWPDLAGPPETTAPATPAATGDPGDEETEEAEEAEESDAPEVVPAVTVPQMERIMRSVAVFTTEVDEARDAERLPERFTGPALEARKANYVIRGSIPDHPALPAIPAAPLTLTLPQQATGWPRTVLTIAKNSDDETVAPTALVLRQESPRENYKVLYATALVPDADVPEVAPASIGAPPINPEFKGLVMPTGQVAPAYADVLLKGDESEYAPLFDPEGDVIRQQLGVEGQQAIAEALPDTADIAFSNEVGASPTVALATNDSGALVTVSLKQTEKVTPNDGGTIGFEAGAPGAALSGFSEKSAKGVQRVIGIQLMFYVPAVGSDEQIRLLGWSESLIGASEVQ